ncbi:MAG: DUF3299 domain-containing protein [Xanthomonadales bacterium]|jgi:hypothetical protein|nr:DUF3299 domain-containing protein [Xanthomonadales bacterium]MCX7052392.1 DUF3299 domain-containing protein [Pseudomonadota bacterium]
MHTKRLRLATLSALLVVSLCSAVAQSITPPPVGTPAPVVKPGPKAPAGAARELDWDELLPQDARARFSGGPPPPTHDTLGEGGLAAQQVMDFSVNKALDGALIKIPGFIVPLDVGKDGLVTDFFLVPYFGACIHVPPPPPNQIVHVRISKGIALDSIYEAYWITGRMKVVNKSTRLGASAYQLAASNVEIYKY